jgi:hypothetical protein
MTVGEIHRVGSYEHFEDRVEMARSRSLRLTADFDDAARLVQASHSFGTGKATLNRSENEE